MSWAGRRGEGEKLGSWGEPGPGTCGGGGGWGWS